MTSTQTIYIIQEIGKNISPKHLAFFIAFLIDIFKELQPEHFKENPKGRKRKYPLEELLGLNIWGDINNKESCRQKAQLCKNNDESVKVLIESQPEKSKINDFNNQEKELIHAFDNFIVEFCLVCGLVDADKFVADGTFLDGYCNDFKALYPDEIDYILKFLTRCDEHENEYKTLYSYYYENNELNNEIIPIKKELKDNINVEGINLIIKALKNDEEYTKVMDKLDHMCENINQR